MQSLSLINNYVDKYIIAWFIGLEFIIIYDVINKLQELILEVAIIENIETCCPLYEANLVFAFIGVNIPVLVTAVIFTFFEYSNKRAILAKVWSSLFPVEPRITISEYPFFVAQFTAFVWSFVSCSES